ncbi:uncharacterized protein [Chelonus insularis]|uniref:uncharacterized protein isoform X2 n=1 Tax=Chelonus insularis TaxID=460826 RepID=UPI00158D01D9|nr:uncharacterized protein LOC118067111 isoform X2 [Chelonus insularis]
MPRISGDGEKGGGEKPIGGFGGWLGAGVTRSTSGTSGSGYIVLGGTKYGVRISQESLPTSNSIENSSDLDRSTYRSNFSKDKLTEKNGMSGLSGVKTTLENKSSIDLTTATTNVTDCCCIGPRSRLPLSRIPLSPNIYSSGDGGISNSSRSIGNAGVDRVRGGVGGQSLLPPTKSKFARLPSNLNANNNCGGLQIGSHYSQSQSSSSSSSSTNSTSAVFTTLSTTFAPIIPSVSVSRQISQWTKHHHPSKLQESTTTAVDRLHKFRWSGGGGGSGKKPSSSPRSEKAERLRELTEKLKNPAPVPPPRRPSRLHSTSPPLSQHNHYHHPHQHRNNGSSVNNKSNNDNNNNKNSNNNDNSQVTSKLNILSYPSSGESECGNLNFVSKHDNGNPKTFSSSLRVGEDSQIAQVTSNEDEKVNHQCSTLSPRRTSWSSNESVIDKRTPGNTDKFTRSIDAFSDSKHLRQCSDSVVDSAKCTDLYNLSIPSIISNESSQSEIRDAVARLEPRGPLLSYQTTGVPFRSASFSQVDFNKGNIRHRSQPNPNTHRTEFKDVRINTLPRIKGVSTTPGGSTTQNIPNYQSPRISTASIDSTLLTPSDGTSSNQNHEEFRPKSDGSESLTTSSALTSPEPPVTTSQELKINQTQLDSPSMINDSVTENADKMIDFRVETSVAETKEPKVELHEVIITPPPEESRLSQTSETNQVPSETTVSSETSTFSGKVRRYRGDTSKRRKGVYITQWPEPSEYIPMLDRNKLSAQSSEEREEKEEKKEKDELLAAFSDVSDCEGHVLQRYSKRPLRGPYGQMLEAEMAKPKTVDIALGEHFEPKRKTSANLTYNSEIHSHSEPPTPSHHRTTSSPSKLEGLPEPSPELLAQLLRGSSERMARTPTHRNDTRTHVVVELYDTEKSYVEALQILVNKYLQTLKGPDNAGLIDSTTVDEIFYKIPAILSHHEIFLEELRKRLDTWELGQTIGDVFLNVFTKPAVLETYTLFLNNWKSAKRAIKTACQAKPAFARFLETMEREHKGKLGLDQLLIKPVQKIPRYELLIQRLLKHTDTSHPDYELLTAAQKEVHELVVKINCTERESLEWEQQQTTLREVQSLVEGLAGIVANDRAFIRHDLVTIASNQGTRKERALFLFSDLLVITSIKRRSGTIRKPSTSSCPNSLMSLLEANKYKLLMRISLSDLEVMKAKDENLRKMAREVDHLREDCATLAQLQELAATLHGSKHQLEDLIKELLAQTQRQLIERNAAHSQLACLEFTLNTQSGVENISVMFTKPDKRASWEDSFNEAKQKLALSTDKRPSPEFLGPLPIRKTRAGLQFTCASPTISNGHETSDVWVCNSDGYVGQVCVLSLNPEPAQVTSCNGVCNSRILCVAGIPATPVSSDLHILHDKKMSNSNNSFSTAKSGISISVQDADASERNINLDSSSSSSDSDSDDIPRTETTGGSLYGDLSSIDGTMEEDINQPTMWLGTEDGCIHVYNCNDNIRIKKNKVKIQHGSSVQSIIYLDNKVFVALANGDVTIYSRDAHYGWSTLDALTVSVGTPETPVTKMVPVSITNKLWCSCHNSIKVLNTMTMEVEHSFNVNGENGRPVSYLAASNGLGVWISLHNSAVLKLFHTTSYECLTDINIAPAVTKMLATDCDDIIRQHKAACLRVTALLACNDILWIGTSAGVLLTVPIPHIKSSTQRLPQSPPVIGIPHGHTGHVRFITCVEAPSSIKSDISSDINRCSIKMKSPQNNLNRKKLLIISGGDGYEDFRGPQGSTELQAGREDSTNHLLLWKI